jgi:parallel beta-helix repeat protein
MKKILAIAVCLAAASPMLAADGAIPIWQPMTITQPGHYVLTRNITDSDLRTLDISGVSDVEIDLNGFTVENTGGGRAIFGWGADRLHVRDGTVKGGGVFAYFSQNVRFARLTIKQPNGDGIDLEDSSGVLLDNVILDAGGSGIYAWAFDLAFVEVTVAGNVIEDADDRGIYLGKAQGSVVEDNRVLGGFRGIEVYLGDGGMLSRNTVQRSEYGIYLVGGEGMHVQRNTVRECDQTGLYLDHADFHHIEANVLTGNDRGLYFDASSDDNVYRGNTARGNTTVDFVDSGIGNTSHRDNYMPGQL